VTFGLSTLYYCYCLSAVTQFVLSHFPHLRCISSPSLQSRRDSTRILPLRHTPRNVGHSSLSYFRIRSSPLVEAFVCDTPFFLIFLKRPLLRPLLLSRHSNAAFIASREHHDFSLPPSCTLHAYRQNLWHLCYP
jgi:hypothetical protein